MRIWEGFRREASWIRVLKDGGDLNRRAGQGAVVESGAHMGRDWSTQVLQTIYWVRSRQFRGGTESFQPRLAGRDFQKR